MPEPQRPSLRTAKDFIWQAAGENFSARFHITPELITLKAKGKSPKDASPLLARAGDHRYEIEACLELNNAEASAGLVIYYNKDMHFGLGFRPGELLRYRRGAVHTSLPKTEITVMMENAAYGYAYAIMTTLFPDGTAPTVRHGTNIHGDLTCKATITIHWENSSLSVLAYMQEVKVKCM